MSSVSEKEEELLVNAVVYLVKRSKKYWNQFLLFMKIFLLKEVLEESLMITLNFSKKIV